MPAKDRYHDAVKRALIKDGWTIEEEQVKLRIGKRRLWVDLRASHPVDNRHILIEIKGFESSGSSVEELAGILGQYIIYQAIMAAKNLDIPVYLAAPAAAAYGILNEDIGQVVRRHVDIKLIVYEPVNEEVLTWSH